MNIQTLLENPPTRNSNRSSRVKNVNNAAYNKELVSVGVESLITIFATVIGIAASSVDNIVEADEIVLFALEDLIHPLAAMGILPTFVYAGNSDLRKYAIDYYRQLF